jgi:hypothetical protein
LNQSKAGYYKQVKEIAANWPVLRGVLENVGANFIQVRPHATTQPQHHTAL